MLKIGQNLYEYIMMVAIDTNKYSFQHKESDKLPRTIGYLTIDSESNTYSIDVQSKYKSLIEKNRRFKQFVATYNKKEC